MITMGQQELFQRVDETERKEKTIYKRCRVNSQDSLGRSDKTSTNYGNMDKQCRLHFLQDRMVLDVPQN